MSRARVISCYFLSADRNRSTDSGGTGENSVRTGTSGEKKPEVVPAGDKLKMGVWMYNR
jgi:hypothetical protein